MYMWGVELAPQIPWGAGSDMENSVHAIRGRRKQRLILLHWEVYMMSHWKSEGGEGRC